MKNELSKKETRHLWIFFAATILWTWIVGMVPVMLGINNTTMGGYLFVFTAGIAPSCVGIIMVFKTYTKAARRDYFERFIPTWQGAWFILLYLILFILFMTAALSFIIGEYPDFQTLKGFVQNPLSVLSFIFFMYLYKLNKIITLHFHAETVNDNLPLLVYPSEETLNRQIDLLDA